MSRRQSAEEGLLFDLPLDRQPADRAAARPAPPPEAGAEAPPEQPPLPLAEQAVVEGDGLAEGEVQAEAADERPAGAAVAKRGRWVRRGSTRPALHLRLVAGLIDLGACAAVLALLLVALLAQGVRPAPGAWPAGAVFLLTFSFLYSVLPLAFWGRTPGMSVAGLKATARDGRPLSFSQAAGKWLGSVLTVALAGLPVLLALSGRRSLSDLTGGALTRPAGSPG